MCRQAEFSVQTRDSIQRLFGLITDSKARIVRVGSTWNEAWRDRIHTGLSTSKACGLPY